MESSIILLLVAISLLIFYNAIDKFQSNNKIKLLKNKIKLLNSQNVNKANHTQTLNNMTIDTGGKEQSPCSTDKSGNGTDNVHNANSEEQN